MRLDYRLIDYFNLSIKKMILFFNLDLLSVGMAVAGIGTLGFTIYFSNRKSVTNRSLFYFSLFTVAWSFVNYLSRSITGNLALSFWLQRAVIFVGTWHAFSFFGLSYVFPGDDVIFPGWFRKILLPLVAITSLLNLSPLVFNKVTSVSAQGEILSIQNGPGIALFGSLILFLILGGIFLMARKTIKAGKEERRPYIYVLVGIFITFILIVIFNFILPAFFSNTRFIPLGAVFIFPFVAFTSYSIYRHKLFNIKVLATAGLTFVLTIVTFLEILFSDNLTLVVFRSSVFLLVLAIGVSLIKSVLREVEAKEKVQVLAKQLETANAKLKRADHAKSEFLSIAAHQLRTPLTGIKGYVSMFLEGDFGKLTKAQIVELEKVFRSSDRLTRLVDVFLNVSRIETGRLELKKDKVKIVEVLDEVVEDLTQAAQKKNLKLTVQKPTEAIEEMFFDRDKIHDVMMNLVDNSIKYTQKGWVNVRLNRSKSLISFEVRDSGIGIDPDEIDKLFHKFSRAEAVSRIHTGGSGLGLFIAKKIIEAHGGRIWAESPGEGKGSTFTFTLPIESAEASAPAPVEPASVL